MFLLLHIHICLRESLQCLGGAFIFAIENLVAVGVRIYFSATTQTKNRLVNNIWESVVAIGNPVIVEVQVPVYSITTKHNWRLLFAVLGAFVDAIGKTVAIRVYFCFSAAT